ncbi:MAG: hypothetical protein DMD85_21800 [Candidatus Rokuibacteriota bacterium]|nr:MAG: hypothetical protein DMD85_21800 [Candidatus Rokubacteria bacterium]
MIVAALSVTETVTWGIIYYGFPVFLRPMEQDLGASRVAVTAAFSIGLGTSALASISVGRWLDRRGPRALMTVGSCLATLLTFAWARVESLATLYVVWFLMGLAMATTLYEPAFAVVVSWFARGRDRALLTVTLVAGLASTIFMPIEAALLERMGWRSALTVLAVVLGTITIPIHALLLRQGTAGRTAGVAEGAAPSLTLGQAARTAIFWVLGIAFVVSNFATAAVTTHLIPFLVERGYSAAVAAAAWPRPSAWGNSRCSRASARSSRSSCCRARPTGWPRSPARRRSRRSSARATTARSPARSRSAPTARAPSVQSAPRCCSSASARTRPCSGCSRRRSSPPAPRCSWRTRRRARSAEWPDEIWPVVRDWPGDAGLRGEPSGTAPFPDTICRCSSVARESHPWRRDALAQAPGHHHAVLSALSARHGRARSRDGLRHFRAAHTGRLRVGMAEHRGAGPA